MRNNLENMSFCTYNCIVILPEGVRHYTVKSPCKRLQNPLNNKTLPSSIERVFAFYRLSQHGTYPRIRGTEISKEYE